MCILLSHPAVSDSLRPQGLQHASLFLIISWSLFKFLFIASVMPSSCHILWHPLFLLPLIFPSIRDFSNESSVHIRDQNTGTSVLPSVPPVNIQSWFPVRLTGLILLSKGVSGVFSSTTVRNHWFSDALPSLWSSSHNHIWPLGRPLPWLYGPLSAE